MPFDVEEIIEKLNNEQKIRLLTGLDWWHTVPLEEFGVPSVRMSDGASGIRGTKFFQSVPAAALPCGSALGATWDRNLVRQAGDLLGKECIAKGVHCWLGPNVNIQRSPLGGRNAESFGEDPHLMGILASAIIQGCQSAGVIATIKHFICNDQENEKSALSALVTDRAMREVYLRPFQIAAREADPGALMTAYNKVNGYHCGELPLLEEVVRTEWQWNPLVMSDWFGTFVGHTTVNAGLDLEMPGPTLFRGKGLMTAVSTGDVKQSILDQRVRSVLSFVQKASKAPVSRTEGQRNFPEDQALNRALSSNSIVLLQNKDKVLPLPKQMKKLALIGSHMQDLSVLGFGSTTLEPYYTIHPFDAIRSKVPEGTEIRFEIGAYAHKRLPILNSRLLRNTTLSMYNHPPTTADRASVVDLSLRETYFQLGDYQNPALNFDLFYATTTATFVPDASGWWDFGLSCYGTANLYIDDRLIIDNTTKQVPGTSFFSEGTREELGAVEVVAGKSYQLRVEFGSAATANYHQVGGLGLGGGGVRLGACARIDVQEGTERAAKAAADADYAIICTGLNGEWEGEGNDRESMALPPGVDSLIARVASANPKTIVVNMSGSPVSMPWASHVPGIIQAWFGGNEAGNSIADVLFGDFNPCGKLPMSWPHDEKCNPSFLNFGSTQGRCIYGEDIYVGYKYYDRVGRGLHWSFGHGLSYTSFEISSLKLVSADEGDEDGNGKGNRIKTFPATYATVTVENTGHVAGAEVVQLYIAAPTSTMPRPNKELHGFVKVHLEPGQKQEVKIDIDPYAMSYWDELERNWCIEKGKYRVTVSSTSSDNLGEKRPRLGSWLEIARTKRWLGL